MKIFSGIAATLVIGSFAYPKRSCLSPHEIADHSCCSPEDLAWTMLEDGCTSYAFSCTDHPDSRKPHICDCCGIHPYEIYHNTPVHRDFFKGMQKSREPECQCCMSIVKRLIPDALWKITNCVEAPPDLGMYELWPRMWPRVHDSIPKNCRRAVLNHLRWHRRICRRSPEYMTEREWKRCDVHKSLRKKSHYWGFPTAKAVAEEIAADAAYMTFVEPLGSGKEAEVWRVCDNENGREVAVKLFRRAYAPDEKFKVSSIDGKNKKSYRDAIRFNSLDPSFVMQPIRSFLVEQPKFRRLKWHSIYYKSMLAFDLAKQDLGDFANLADGDLKESEIACVAHGLVNGVIAILNSGRVWMDCKPRNVLMFGYQPKIADFGFALRLGSTAWAPGPGSVGYRPPENLKMAEEDPDSEIVVSPQAVSWAVGASIFYLTYNRHAFGDEDEIAALSSGDLPKFRSWKPISDDLYNLMRGLLEVDPKKRLTLEEAVEHPFFWKFCRQCEGPEWSEGKCCCRLEYTAEIAR